MAASPTPRAWVTYRGVAPGVDLRLEARPGELKETVVLASGKAPASFVFPLKLTRLTARLEGGQVELADETGAVRGVIPAGTSVDVAGKPGKVAYELIQQGGAPALKVSVDEDWLRDPKRAFPVEMDQTVHLDIGKAEPALAQHAQAECHELVVVGFVACRARELGDAGATGELDRDLGNQDAFEIEADDLHGGGRCRQPPRARRTTSYTATRSAIGICPGAEAASPTANESDEPNAPPIIRVIAPAVPSTSRSAGS